jgi:predicted transcriptional regulator
MAKDHVLCTRADDDTKAKVDALADATERNRTSVLRAALVNGIEDELEALAPSDRIKVRKAYRETTGRDWS